MAYDIYSNLSQFAHTWNTDTYRARHDEIDIHKLRVCYKILVWFFSSWMVKIIVWIEIKRDDREGP